MPVLPVKPTELPVHFAIPVYDGPTWIYCESFSFFLSFFIVQLLHLIARQLRNHSMFLIGTLSFKAFPEGLDSIRTCDQITTLLKSLYKRLEVCVNILMSAII